MEQPKTKKTVASSKQSAGKTKTTSSKTSKNTTSQKQCSDSVATKPKKTATPKKEKKVEVKKEKKSVATKTSSAKTTKKTNSRSPKMTNSNSVFPDKFYQPSGMETPWCGHGDCLKSLFAGKLSDPHGTLGMHLIPDFGIVIRVFAPTATQVTAVWATGQAPMSRISDEGLFLLVFPNHFQHFAYQLVFDYNGSIFETEDPYCFTPQIGQLDMHLFNEGTHENVYEFMGAHVRNVGGVLGTVFCVWAPNASRVSVVGDFNNWNGLRHPMRLMGASGIWELFIPHLADGEVYKYEIRAANGDVFTKLDPYAFAAEKRPNNAGIINNSIWNYSWNDQEWMAKRVTTPWRQSPMNIYEVHLASWQHPNLRPINNDDEMDHHNYRELAHVLADYVIEMGYTHIELMPILEHPLDISWGYQVSGYFAPTSRFGTPDDFAYFVDYLHQKGIGVLLDWVPAHFPKDAFMLGRFDGTALYEHADPRQGEHQDWGTYIFNFGRNEVLCFLLGNALYWLGKFHIDGLRVDAVASMLYLDYSRENGQWIPNKFGGNENIDAIDFLRRLNVLTNERFPGTLMIAEESTMFPGVSMPTYAGGLGFHYKWNMGWMHDVLDYFKNDPIYRCYHQNQLTLPLLYFTTENFILPLSHDEVVHGKCSLLNKMPGDQWQKFANLRTLYTWMITHPGKKLLFMGGEFGQWIEWNCKQGLDWLLLAYETHQQLQKMVAKLNHLYKKMPALWEDDFSTRGFQWIDASNYQQSIVAYCRWDNAHQRPIVTILNLTPNPHENYEIGVPLEGNWVEILNSDEKQWGGSGITNPGALTAQHKKELFHGVHQAVTVTLPPLGAIILVPETQLHDYTL